MKKVLIVLACIAIVLPLFALSAFAEDETVPVSITQVSNVNVTIQYRNLDTQVLAQGYTSGLSQSVPCDFVPGVVYSIICTFYSGSSWKNSTCKYNGAFLSTDPDNPTVIENPPTSTFSYGSSVSDAPTYYVVVEVPPEPLAPVADGVTTFIGYGGQVLSFLTNNSTLLFLIGLSVGLCLVIPFGVSKIKDLLKGY